jgi:hypothetical protein
MCYNLIVLDRFSLIVTKQYDEASKRWNSALGHGESACVIFPYLSDRQIRIKQFIDSVDSSKLIPIVIDLSLRSIDEFDDLKNNLNQLLPENIRKETFNISLKDRKEVFVLVVGDGESLLKPENDQILEMLQRLMLEQENLVMLSAFETDIFSKHINVSKYDLIFQNIFYYPLYDDETVMEFVGFLFQLWQAKIPQPIRKTITYNSGGSFWLAKEACRIYRENGEWSKDSPTFQFRINSIIRTLNEEEKTIISACPHLNNYQEHEVFKHLKKIGMIDENNQSRIPEVGRIIGERIEKENSFEMEAGDILLKGISMYNVLSATEFSLLKFFMKKPNMAISRDEIAKVLWPSDTENRYSEWAIDQAVKRLRDRLVSLRLSPTIIRSVRGVGYEFRA